MTIKRILLSAATATAVAFGGASVATAQETEGSTSGLPGSSESTDDSNLLGSLENEDGILGSFVGDDAFDTLGNITTVISLIVAGFNLSNVIGDIQLPKLPF